MLRAVLLGVLSVTAIASCKKSEGTSASAKVVPGVAAGKVLEVKGGVSVKHGDDTKALAVGDTVEADDTVITTADGNVVIELAHNNVRWELGPNKQQKVRESIAFKAAKNTEPTANVEQDTAAAGRPAERSAVGTTATAVEEPAAEEAKKADSEAPPPPAAAADEAPGAAPAPAPERKRTTRGTHRAAKKEADVEIPSAEAAMAPPPPPADAPAPTTRATRGGTRGPMVIAKPVSPAAPSLDAKSGAGATTSAAPRMAPPPPSAAMLVAQKQSALHACMAGHADPVTVVVTVAAGKPIVKLTSKSAIAASLDACMKKVVSTISFTTDGNASVVVKP